MNREEQDYTIAMLAEAGLAIRRGRLQQANEALLAALAAVQDAQEQEADALREQCPACAGAGCPFCDGSGSVESWTAEEILIREG